MAGGQELPQVICRLHCRPAISLVSEVRDSGTSRSEGEKHGASKSQAHHNTFSDFGSSRAYGPFAMVQIPGPVNVDGVGVREQDLGRPGWPLFFCADSAGTSELESRLPFLEASV
jgi:hypothetical protein